MIPWGMAAWIIHEQDGSLQVKYYEWKLGRHWEEKCLAFRVRTSWDRVSRKVVVVLKY